MPAPDAARARVRGSAVRAGRSTAKAPRRPPAVSVGFLGTYPPIRCGIATFNAALLQAMRLRDLGVVASVDEPGAASFGPEVVGELVRGSAASAVDAAEALAAYDVVVVQHEFGIYGGNDGREVLNVVRALTAPTIIVLHTVLRTASPSQRAIIEELADLAQAVVVPSLAARARLLETHDLEVSKLSVVPHGARLNFGGAEDQRSDRRPVILTWGLIGPGKGIEFGIEAMVWLADLDPPPLYVVHGGTHPRVLERHGEAYRESLVARARELGVSDLVEFDARYVDTNTVLAVARAADVVLLPYQSRDQVVSGVLVEALASAKPVVATRFPHATELLVAGSGILVPHDDSAAIAWALRRVLGDPDLRAQMADVAVAQARRLAWPNVGRIYRDLALSLARQGGNAR